MTLQTAVDGEDVIDVEQLEPGGRTSATYEVLREWIVSGKLAPDEDVSQLELTRRLGISRTPLREALRLLTRDGLVTETLAHRRVRISPLSMVDLDQVYALRIPVEALAIWQTVPKLTVSDLVEIRADLELISHEDTLIARNAHRRFHAGLGKYAGDRTQEFLAGYMLHSERYQRAFVNNTKAGINRKAVEHRLILKACESGNRELARELLVDHLASTALALMKKNEYKPAALALAMKVALCPDL
jgi:DNA-binding GntR family transcriptional regulator